MAGIQRSPFKILIVDDDPVICHTLKTVAERKGFLVTTFSNVREAYREVPEMKFDLAIVDYDLGLVTGSQLSNFVEGHGKKPPVVLMSSSGPIDPSKWGHLVIGTLGKRGGPGEIIGGALQIFSRHASEVPVPFNP